MNSQYEHQIFWTPDLSLLGDKWDLVAAQMGLREMNGNHWLDKDLFLWQLTPDGFKRVLNCGVKSPDHEDRGQ